MVARRLRIALVLASALLLDPARIVQAGPLQDCCSAKGTFCILPFAGGKGACTAAGGQLFRANACLPTHECGVAHQLQAVARARVSVQTPEGPKTDTLPLRGTGDLIETEMLQLELQGVGPLLGPSSLKKSPSMPAPGAVIPEMPPAPFPAESFFDVFFELDISDVGMLHTMMPQRLVAEISAFPPLGMPYHSTASVELFDMQGRAAGELLELELLFEASPDSDGDGVVDSGDLCPATMEHAVVDDDGCSLDQLCPCPARNHGQHVSCMAHAARRFVRAGLISRHQFAELVRDAARVPCVAPPPTPTATATATSTATETPTATPTEPPCPSCHTNCGGTCVETCTDFLNCGACGLPCSSNNVVSPICSAGVCTGDCVAGFADCNSNKLVDGCEVDLNTSWSNCGACGVFCLSP